jgi:hypothetical protein
VNFNHVLKLSQQASFKILFLCMPFVFDANGDWS